MSARRLAFAAGPVAIPWTVLVSPGGDLTVDLVFAWGLLDPETLHAVTITDYLFEHTAGLPEHLLAWPTSVLLWLLAAASVAGGVVVGQEDRRITAGLFVLAGLAALRFSAGIGLHGGPVALPVAAVVLWLLAWLNRPANWFR